jgi:RimJ/RimL family protein N-acetyltransferase
MIIKGRIISFRMADISDSEFILQLRMDQERNRFLSPVKNDLSLQTEWMKAYKEREKQQLEYYFIIIDSAEIPLGTVRLYDFRDSSFSWGSWLIKADSPLTTALESALLVYEFAFYHLGFNATHFEVMRGNVKVRAFHERFGAKVIESDDTTDFFVLSKAGYEQVRSKYVKYLPEKLLVSENPRV